MWVFPPLNAACMADVTGVFLAVLDRVRELTAALSSKLNEGSKSYFTRAPATLFSETVMNRSDAVHSNSRIIYAYLLQAQT